MRHDQTPQPKNAAPSPFPPGNLAVPVPRRGARRLIEPLLLVAILCWLWVYAHGG